MATLKCALNTPDPGSFGLVEVPGGVFYGVTQAGGVNHIGSLFRATLGPSASTLYSFKGNPDGEIPRAGLVLASDGMLYGTTGAGGIPGCGECGIVFGLLPGTGGKVAQLHALNFSVDGGVPLAPLTEGSDGWMYGTASTGGTPCCGGSGAGTVFRFPKSTLPQWDGQFGDVGLWDGASSVVADSTGKVYVAGVANTRLYSTATGSFYIARFKSDGTLDTMNFNAPNGFVQFGPGLSTDYMARIRLDKTGNIYVAGYTAGSVFGQVNHGGFDGWVAKFNTKGKLVWPFMFGTLQDDRLFDIALDSTGKVYLSGSTTGNLGGTLTGVRDGFVGVLTAKHNKVTHLYDFTLTTNQSGATGETRWGRRIAYCQNVTPPQVYTAGDDVVSGNAWLSRFSAKNIPGGALKTVTIAGGSGPGLFEAHGVGADASCDVFMAGHNVSHPLPSITDEHFYLNKYDSLLNGQFWEVDGPLNSGALPAPEDFVHDLSVDSLDRVFVGGTTTSPNLWGNPNDGEAAPWYAAYDGTLTTKPLKPLGDGLVHFAPGPSVITEGNGIFANATGVYMVGNTNGNVAGHPDPAFSDAYVWAFSPLP